MSAPEPVFEAPWHAQAFAVAVHLHENGQFTWSEWAAIFSETLAQHGAHKDLNGGDDYFLAWVAALERICTEKGLAEAEALSDFKTKWEQAYLTTSHGAPVHLKS